MAPATHLEALRRFHAHLDAYHQPVAPGPEGGIQDSNGNFGTPMMGVVTVR